MFSKVEEIVLRFDVLTAELSSPEAYADPERFARLSKERAELEEIAEVYRLYRKTQAEMSAAFSEAEGETEEMKQLLLEEGHALKGALGELESKLKILLLPKDKNDERGCTLEIRAGAGGEEAALFAYELYRMYMGFCEKHRLSWEVATLSETELGGVKEAVVIVGGKKCL